MNEQELLGSYKLVLGLEVHIQPKTKNKMFCGCSADIWQAEPNTHTCPTCLALPGALPVANFEAVERAQLLGLALNCTLNKNTYFDRKHYFYHDLPKGYQISQYKQPLCIGGYLKLRSGKIAELERIHLEEDTAKSFHEGTKTLIDFNKSGMPLIEIVSKPIFYTVSDAVDYAKKLQNIVRLLGISDADMEKGQMRVEPNISLRTLEMEKEGKLPKYKVEIKNINSFRFMEKGVLAEIKRQRELLDKGETPIQENRGFVEKTNSTVSQRDKEEAQDYRYFPDPDIPPMEFDDKHFEKLKKSLPRLPYEYAEELNEKYGLEYSKADDLAEADLAKKFVGLAEYLSKKEHVDKKTFTASAKVGDTLTKAANILLSVPTSRELSVEDFVLLKLSSQAWDSSLDLEPIVSKVISQNSKAVEDYKKGKEAAMKSLIGAVMRESKGSANPKQAEETLKKFLV